MNQPRDRRKIAFLVLCVACIVAIVIYGVLTMRPRRGPEGTPPPPSAETAAPSPASKTPRAPKEQAATPPTAQPATGPKPKRPSEPGKAAAVPPKPEVKPAVLYFRANALGADYGKLAFAPLNDLAQRHYAADLYCDRLYFSGGNGVCLYADRSAITTYYAIGFNAQMQRRWSFKVNGLPSRVRVSPSGRLAAITVFLAGQSYTSLNFATQTSILNAAMGQAVVDNLEDFSVTRDGVDFKSKDFNFWGVTFARDENRFYATLWSKGNTYLVAGDLEKRTARVIHDNVECPALSPDNTRIAYKKKFVGGLLQGRRLTWHITVLDLKTGTETPLGESRSIDDQVEWLDNDHILYALPESEKGASASTDIWVLPATAKGTPELLLMGDSPRRSSETLRHDGTTGGCAALSSASRIACNRSIPCRLTTRSSCQSESAETTHATTNP
jgi:hypothetical protein